MGRVGSNEQQRAFVKEYESLCYRFNRHEVWQDLVTMIACAISNTVDKRYWEKREEWYMSIIKKYNEHERQVFPRLFGYIVAGMEEYPDCDFLGELYMQLDLGNAKNGQFFTPYDVCKMMAEVTINVDLVNAEIRRRGYFSINDCACGAGATLIAAAMVLKEKHINYQRHAIFIAQDIDYTTGLMCYIQLSLLGCAGYVKIGNTLTDPLTGHVLYGEDKDTTWYTPMYFSDTWQTIRAIAKARHIFGITDPPADMDPAEPAEVLHVEPSPEMPEGMPAEDPRGGVQKSSLEAPPPVEPAEEPTFTLSTSSKKKNAGQLMFDFG